MEVPVSKVQLLGWHASTPVRHGPKSLVPNTLAVAAELMESVAAACKGGMGVAFAWERWLPAAETGRVAVDRLADLLLALLCRPRTVLSMSIMLLRRDVEVGRKDAKQSVFWGEPG